MKEVLFDQRDRIYFLTDCSQLNEALGGFGIQSGNLVVVQAPTGEGKTTFMMRLAINAAKEHKVAYISCGEQDEKELSVRFICMIRQIKYQGVQESSYTPEQVKDLKSFAEHSEAFSNIDVFYEENDPITLSHKLADDGYKFIFIDYLGCLLAPTQDQQYQFLTRVASALKNLATEKNIGIITAMQTNRSLLSALKDPTLDPVSVDETFMADSIGPARKATICLSWFNYKNKRYLVLYKNRFNGQKCSAVIGVDPLSYTWIEYFNPDEGF